MTPCNTTSSTTFGALTFDIEPALEKEKKERSSAFKMVGYDPTVDPGDSRQTGQPAGGQTGGQRQVGPVNGQVWSPIHCTTSK